MKKIVIAIIVALMMISVVFAEKTVKVPILMLHDFTDNITNVDCSTITTEKFKEVLTVLEENDYRTISFEELSKFVDGELEIKDKVFLIAMDDGYRSNYTKAYPVLKEKKMKALISIIGWSVGRDTMLGGIIPINPHCSWAELIEMQDSGLVEIGNHTYDMHKYDEEQKDERKGTIINRGENLLLYRKLFSEDITKLSELIYKNLKKEDKVFCYPYGMYDEITEKLLDDLGYKITLTTDEGINYLTRGSSLKKLKRINITMETDMESLIKEWEKEYSE